MKKIPILILILILGLKLSAQGFDLTIKSNYSNFSNAYVIEKDNNFYFTVGTDISTNFTNVWTKIYKMNQFGILVDSMNLPYAIHDMKLFNQNIYFVGETGLTKTVVFGKVDIQLFDTLNLKHIVSLDYKTPLKLKYMNYCSCFTVSGSSSKTYNPRLNYGFILQVDSNFNYLQEKKYYYFNDTTGPLIWDFNERDDKMGIQIMTEFMGNVSQGGYYSQTLYSLDSSLNIDTTAIIQLSTPNIYGTFPFIVFNPSNRVNIYGGSSNLVKLTDSTFLAAGPTIYDVNVNGVFRSGEQDMIYMILDNRFNITYAAPLGRRPDTIEISGASTMLDKYGKYAYVANSSGKGFSASFALSKIDESGTEIWTKYYKKGNVSYPTSLRATLDGGVMLIGPTFVSATPNLNYDIYVLKVDSNGNMGSVGFADNKISELDFQIYPNPTESEIHLQKLNQFMPYDFTLFDIYGKELISFNWQEDFSTISIENFAKGVYIYQIKDKKGRTASGKIVKK